MFYFCVSVGCCNTSTVSVWEKGLPQNMASEEPLCGQYQCGKAAQIAFLASDCIQYYLARQRMTYLSIFGWSIFLYRLYVAEEPSSVYWRHDYQNAVGMIWHVGLVCTGNCLQSKGTVHGVLQNMLRSCRKKRCKIPLRGFLISTR